MSTSKLAAHHDDVVKMIQQGRSHRDIAVRYGMGKSSVSDYIKGHVGQVAAVTDPAEEVSREELLEAEVRELRTRATQNRRVDVADERLLRAIESALGSTPRSEQRMRHALNAPVDADPEAHHRQLVVLSDFHGGEVVDTEATHGVNTYNWDIMEQRVDETIAALLSHKRNSPDLTGLTIAFAGDMCSGANHQELAESNQYPLAEQGVRMGYLQSRIVWELAQHYPQIDVLVVPGNHPRLPKKPAAKNIHDNMDWVAGLIMEQSLTAVPNVNVTVARGASLFYEIAGRTVYLWHGDGIKSTMPGVPWGGVMRRIAQIAEQHQRRIDHFILGHFHQANVVQGGRIVMNGALKGVDEWVMKNFGGGQGPTQLLLTFDEKRERMTDVRYITPTAGTFV